MKKTIIITIICTLLFAAVIEAGTNYNYYKRMVKRQKIGKVREYWCEDLTADILTRRGDDIIIEKTIGIVLNKRGDGRIIGNTDGHDYISYKRVPGAKKGDAILTICIFTPGNAYEDDICQRFDYIIDRPQRNAAGSF